eukprot:TRINITY_DN15442_c0_g1_i1.p1 TRINITY_DN15442_c0_g1~~TRINITY_DN15442_c0_g1_i1.p1  ORF type:complete len:912 (-),score=122.17 TRINITY_DN15442_c0_g1_i1:157-2499(-)
MVFIHWAFCATSVTICSGSMAERAHMVAYLFFALIMSFIIYPEVAESAWRTSGMLAFGFDGRYIGQPYYDFAGSGVVHLTGGCAAVMGNLLLGRRIMRNDGSPLNTPHSSPSRDFLRHELEGEDEQADISTIQAECVAWPRRFDTVERDAAEFKQAHYLQAMGMFILWVGWFGFNTGSTTATTLAGSHLATRVALNTSLAAGTAGIGGLLYCFCMEKHVDLTIICNSLLSGLVAVTALCDVASPHASMVIGILVGLVVYPLASKMLKRLRLDDPVDAIPVHACGGLVGVLAVAMCWPDCAAEARLGSESFSRHAHFCAEYYRWYLQLAAQLWGSLVLIVWTSSICGVLWFVFALLECLRATEDLHVKRAHAILITMASSEAETDPDLQGKLQDAMDNSPVVRDIIQRHKLPRQDVGPIEIIRVCRELQRAREECVATALEISDWYSIRCTVSMLQRLGLSGRVAGRLRISPWAELSGLGATDIDGRRIFRNVHRAMQSMDRRSRLEHQASATALEDQVSELKAIVSSQDVLLNALAKRRFGSQLVGGSGVRSGHSPLLEYDGSTSPSSLSSPGRRLPTLEETDILRQVRVQYSPAMSPRFQQGHAQLSGAGSAASVAIPVGSGSGGGNGSAPGHGAGSAAVASTVGQHFIVSTPQSLPINGMQRLIVEPRVDSRSTDSGQNGALTPHSATDTTPPPSSIGTYATGRRTPGFMGSSEAVHRLLRVVENQQQLLASLHAQQLEGSPPAPVAPTPSSQGPQEQHSMASQAQTGANGEFRETAV